MSVAPIGPYRLSRGDHVAAALVVSFVTGARGIKIRSWLVAAAAILLAAAGHFVGEPGLSISAGMFVVVLFVVAPALRVRRTSLPIILSVDDEGLVAETGEMRTTYKWATIRSVRRLGPRLFIMVTEGCAVVVADRMTTPANIAALAATVQAHAHA